MSEPIQEILVIYHGNCTDGFSAAYAAWKKFGNQAQYLGMNHGEYHELPDVDGKIVYILDFSFSPELYEQLLNRAHDVILLDHHKSAYKLLCNCKGCFFDLTRSGAMIAWQYFHPQTPVPDFIRYVQDMDLYQFNYTQTEPFYRGIASLPNEFDMWQKLENPDFLQQILDKGQIIQEFYLSQVRELARDAKPITIDGEHGLMVNAHGMFTTDIAHILASQSGTFGLVWSDKEKQVKCGMRSLPSYDASRIAIEFGGGGHPQSCAFTVQSNQAFLNLLDQEKVFNLILEQVLSKSIQYENFCAKGLIVELNEQEIPFAKRLGRKLFERHGGFSLVWYATDETEDIEHDGVKAILTSDNATVLSLFKEKEIVHDEARGFTQKSNHWMHSGFFNMYLGVIEDIHEAVIKAQGGN
jgi:nanoRNase/pAp phosphatase (c-di-AMP/oligoRNAs hydrolase)